MSKPEDINQAAWDAALKCWDDFPPAHDMDATAHDYFVVIARAIMAAKAEERQNAAKRYRDGAGPDTWDFFGEAENAILSDR